MSAWLAVAGLACNRFAPGVVRSTQPLLAAASLADTCACVGASLASNITIARSAVGARALLPVRSLSHLYCLLKQLGCRALRVRVMQMLSGSNESGCCCPCSHILRLHPEALLAQVALMHIAAFYLGHRLAGATVARDSLARARAISLTTGMQARHGV